MKNAILFVSCIGSLGAVTQSEGEISFVTKVDMHAQLPDDEQGKMLRNMIPQYQEMSSTLLFNATQALFLSGNGDTSHKEEKLDDSGNSFQIEIKMDTPQENIYTNVAEGLVVEQKQLMDKIFLIRDTIDPAAWKITGESKLVSGLMCNKATMDGPDGKIEAWYTAQIPVSSGPSGFGGLPGMIVHISMDEGKILITADKIVARELKKGEMLIPDKGKDISREKYAELERKKMEQMEKQYSTGGEGTVIIINE